jgi:hypothetical protein
MKLTLCLCALLGWSVWHPCETLACRYNVRDVGFVDLGTEPYELYCFIRGTTPSEDAALLRDLPAARLRDCPVRVEVLDIDRQRDHPALRHRTAEFAEADTLAVLVSPDGQALPFRLSEPGRSFRDTLSTVLATIVTSPLREELVRAAADAFGVVLLLEGEEADQNTRARQAIAEAIAETAGQMKGLPKAIANPPVVRSLARSAFAQEKVLLWSLGLDAAATTEPRAAVIYGRARWIGPLMKGEEITSRNLSRILSFIGADCECGLDIAWTLGTRLPVRWDEGLQAGLVKSLGFDPENPLVKLEVGRIVDRGGAAKPPGSEVDMADRQAQPSASPGAGVEANLGVRPPAAKPHIGTIPPAPVLAESMPFWQQPRYVVAGLAAGILGTGAFLLLNASRRR